MEQPKNPDLQLVQKAAQGNRKAFTTLFNRYFQSVYNFALMLARDPAVAEDLTQEAFIRAHLNIKKLGPPWNFKAWVFRLTRNYFIDLTRKDKNVDPLEEDLPLRSSGPGPEKETMSRETADRVHGTLNKLSRQHREILVLRELNQFSYSEIGEILEIGDSNVKVSLHRARAAFQESYGIQLLLDDPDGECLEVTALLDALHDGEDLFDQDQFVKEHIKVCEACQKRRQLLIDQSLAFSAFIPVKPPKALARRILQNTIQKSSWGFPPQQESLPKILGLGGFSAVLAVTAWLIFLIIFKTESILPNYPGSGDLQDTPEVLAQVLPTATVADVAPPPLPPTLPSTPLPNEEDWCSPFEDLEISLVMLKIREGSLNLPIYLKMAGGVIGGEDPLESGKTRLPYSAVLGDIPAYKCDLQGFPDRLYCIFTLAPEMPGQEFLFQLELETCELPLYSQVLLLPPPPPENQDQPIGCHAGLDAETCKAEGGEYLPVYDTMYLCFCP